MRRLRGLDAAMHRRVTEMGVKLLSSMYLGDVSREAQLTGEVNPRLGCHHNNEESSKIIPQAPRTSRFLSEAQARAVYHSPRPSVISPLSRRLHFFCALPSPTNQTPAKITARRRGIRKHLSRVTAAAPQPSLDWISGSLRNEEIAFARVGYLLRCRGLCPRRTEAASRCGLFLSPHSARQLRPRLLFQRRRRIPCLFLLQTRRSQSRVYGLWQLRPARYRPGAHPGLQ